MSVEFFTAISPYLVLAFLVSVLALFLAVGAVILNVQGKLTFPMSIIKGVVLSAVSVCVVLFFLYRYMSERPLSEAEQMLSSNNTIVYVDGNRKNIRSELLLAFRERRYTKISGSQPTHFVTIKIVTDEKALVFNLGQDSRNENFFWVYFPDYKWHSSLCYLSISDSLLEG